MQPVNNAGAPQQARAQPRAITAANSLQGAQAAVFRGLAATAQFVGNAPAPVISNRELQQVLDAVQERGLNITELDLASC